MSDSRVNRFKVGDKVVLRCTGVVFTVAGVFDMDNTTITLEGYSGLYNASAFDLYTEPKLPIDVYTTHDLSYIEELEDEVNRLNDLCSDLNKIIEDKDAEIEKLRGITINSNSGMKTDFKPISEMTIEDWQQALEEDWEFEDNEGDTCTMDSVDTVYNVIEFQEYLSEFDVKGVHSGSGNYHIVKRIK